MNKKAISLISGGLDSTLASKLIMEQGIDVVALHFTSPFSSRREKEQGLQAERVARELGIRLILKDKGFEYFNVIKSPRYGYGKNINPCIDCRIFMLQKTREIMAAVGADFIVTGEILGQRPMSQRRDPISIIEKESGLEGLIVRPLSAMHFPPSIPEKEGVIDRDKLLGITGRSRTIQYKLAEQYGLKEFGCPGGGCLLTDSIFTMKLRDLFTYDKEFVLTDVELLSIGRHFRLRPDTKLVVGRDEGENEKLLSLWAEPYVMFRPVGFKGPNAILKGAFDDDIISIAANIIGHYGKHASATISVESNGSALNRHVVENINIKPDHLKI